MSEWIYGERELVRQKGTGVSPQAYKFVVCVYIIKKNKTNQIGFPPESWCFPIKASDEYFLILRNLIFSELGSTRNARISRLFNYSRCIIPKAF